LSSAGPDSASLAEQAPARRLSGDQAAWMVSALATGSRSRRPKLRHLPRVRIYGLPDAVGHLVAAGAERDDPVRLSG
jgi:hypothetical protein